MSVSLISHRLALLPARFDSRQRGRYIGISPRQERRDYGRGEHSSTLVLDPERVYQLVTLVSGDGLLLWQGASPRTVLDRDWSGASPVCGYDRSQRACSCC